MRTPAVARGQQRIGRHRVAVRFVLNLNVLFFFTMLFIGVFNVVLAMLIVMMLIVMMLTISSAGGQGAAWCCRGRAGP